MTLRLRSARLVLAGMILLIGAALASPAFAQSLTPIAVGENKPGEVTAAAPSVSYVLTVNSPQTISVQVFGLTTGFAPAFNVLTISGVQLLSVTPPPGATLATGSTALSSAGLYQIVVSSANGQTGQFALSVQGGAPLPVASPLVLGQPQAGVVSLQSPINLYSFTALPTDNAVVTVRAISQTDALEANGPLVELRDQETNEVLANSSARLIGVAYRVPLGTVSYVVQVSHSGGPASEAFSVCLESENSAPFCPGSGPAVTPTPALIPPTATPVPPTRIPPVQIPPNGPCSVASAVGTPVNVRSGPGTNYSIVTQLAVTTTALVVGRLPDSSWYQVNVNGIPGWVSGSVVVIGGQCALIPAVTLTPTLPATTATVIPAASSTPTLTATATMPEPVPTLNYSLPAVYGSTALTSGFVPDPFTVGVTAGGPASAASAGGGCYGYTTSAPTFSVNYTSGAFPTLRFYFIGSGDTTMIINTPGGNFVCVDDSFGTLNPTIDFNSPSSGRYDVWVAAYAQGGSAGGTLYVTENTGNHP